jgi:hypothetical protein
MTLCVCVALGVCVCVVQCEHDLSLWMLIASCVGIVLSVLQFRPLFASAFALTPYRYSVSSLIHCSFADWWCGERRRWLV